MGDDDTTRFRPTPEAPTDNEDQRAKQRSTLRPGAAGQTRLAPPGLRSAPPPVPPAREDDTLPGIPAGVAGPAPAPVPKSVFGASTAPQGAAGAKSRFKQTLVATPGLSAQATQGPPSEPLREPPAPEPQAAGPGKRSPYARTLLAADLKPPPAPAMPAAQTPSKRPGSTPIELNDTVPSAAPAPRPAASPRPPAPTRAPTTQPMPGSMPGPAEGRRSGTRPKTSAPPPPAARPQAQAQPREDKPSAVPALRLDDSDLVAQPPAKPAGVPQGRGKLVGIAAVVVVLAVGLMLWLASGDESPEASPPPPVAIAPPPPAEPPAEPTPTEPEAKPEEAAPATATPEPKAEAPTKPAAPQAPRARAKRKTPARAAKATPAAPKLAPPPPVRSAEDEANIDDARSILKELDDQPVIKMKPADRDTAERALLEAMGKPSTAPPSPEPEAPSEPAPVLELKPSE